MEHRVVYTVPYDSEVEYLESTGTQKINTGYYADSSITSFELNIGFSGKFNASGSKAFISSSDNGEPYKLFSMNFGSTSREHHKIFNWFGIRYESGGKPKSYVVTFSDINKITYSNGTATFNNSTISTEVTSGRRQRPLMILGTPNTTFSAYTARLYSFKITEGDSLILNLIPVRVGNIGYMYDKVSGKLFSNQGTGNFILGQDVANQVPNIRRVFRFGNKRFVIPCGLEEGVDYQRYDWLKAYISTNTNMMNLPINSKKFEFKRNFIQVANSGYFSTSDSDSTYSYYTQSDRKVKIWSTNAQTIIYTSSIALSSGILTIISNDNGVTIISATNTVSPPFYGNPKSIPFNNVSNVNSIQLTSSIKVDGVIQYIPCQLLRSIPTYLDANGISRQAGECGMIDLISGKFYGNVANTGTFTVENDN